MTPIEKQALAALTDVAHKKGWLDRAERLDRDTEKVLRCPMSKVQGVLVGALKPGRRLVTAVKFSDGKMQEVADADLKALDAASSKKGGPYREDPKAAVTVAEPTRGCPAPDFEAAELRASAVLAAFLDEEQLRDFTERNAFVAVGSDTGHRYALTSRHSRDGLNRHGGRTMYDLDDREAFCVHDWTVPAGEELLAMFTLLSLPGYESWMRHMPASGYGPESVDGGLR